MLDLAMREWRGGVILSRDFATPGERSEFFARTRKGEFVPLSRGAYLEEDVWRELDEDARYRARAKAAAALADRELVLSHHSAAALWRLPWVGGWPRRVHVIEPSAAGGRSSSVLTRHTVGVPEPLDEIDGLTVTSLARTVVDLARAGTFGQAVAVADAALRRTEHPLKSVPRTFLVKDDLYHEVDAVPVRHGSVKARRAIDFADGDADRPGESMSRVGIHIAGLTKPQLQVPIAGASGRSWIVDFWWPEFNIIGEFDGRSKYTDPRYLRGRTPGQVVYDEKLREDDLRAAGHGMSRWPWEKATSPGLLRAHLLAAGVR
ncbi:MAG: hypothetical protein ACYCZY_08060 [Lacisediminihabitans sp.]